MLAKKVALHLFEEVIHNANVLQSHANLADK